VHFHTKCKKMFEKESPSQGTGCYNEFGLSGLQGEVPIIYRNI
jgi:hypothetical protein